MTKLRLTSTAALTAGLLLPLTAVGSADASGGTDDRVIRTGSCSAGALWKVKVKSDNGQLEFEGEVDSNQNGQTWRWRIRHNGALSARGVGVTQGPSGSFTVERRMVDLAGVDHVVFRARDLGSDQVCRGVVNFG